MVRGSIEKQGLKVLAVGAALALSVSSAEAGLLDVLFGRRPPTPQTYYMVEPGLDLTVRPRESAPKAKRGDAAMRESGRFAEPSGATILQTPMEIDGDPDWFLRDTTLRRGDIIVRKDGALVYEGARHASRFKDFVALSDSRLLSARAKAQIKLLVEAPRDNLIEFVAHRAVKPSVVGAAVGVRPPTLGAPVAAVEATRGAGARR